MALSTLPETPPALPLRGAALVDEADRRDPSWRAELAASTAALEAAARQSRAAMRRFLELAERRLDGYVAIDPNLPASVPDDDDYDRACAAGRLLLNQFHALEYEAEVEAFGRDAADAGLAGCRPAPVPADWKVADDQAVEDAGPDELVWFVAPGPSPACHGNGHAPPVDPARYRAVRLLVAM
jgi:hypothetical protein